MNCLKKVFHKKKESTTPKPKTKAGSRLRHSASMPLRPSYETYTSNSTTSTSSSGFSRSGSQYPVVLDISQESKVYYSQYRQRRVDESYFDDSGDEGPWILDKKVIDQFPVPPRGPEGSAYRSPQPFTYSEFPASKPSSGDKCDRSRSKSRKDARNPAPERSFSDIGHSAPTHPTSVPKSGAKVHSPYQTVLGSTSTHSLGASLKRHGATRTPRSQLGTQQPFPPHLMNHHAESFQCSVEPLRIHKQSLHESPASRPKYYAHHTDGRVKYEYHEKGHQGMSSQAQYYF